MPGIWFNVIVVVSGGGSAATRDTLRPRTPALLAAAAPITNVRRLQSSRLSFMETSSARMGPVAPSLDLGPTWDQPGLSQNPLATASVAALHLSTPTRCA